MELRREFFYTIGTLVALNVLLAFGAIGLFVRMLPAIERILEENVYSNIAAEEMLAVLAESPTARVPTEGRRRVEDAFRRAKSNVTEPEEIPVLDAIERNLRAALDGERDAVVAEVRAIQNLIAINRDAMRKVDREAQRLGRAGAWAAVFVGFLSFLLSVVVLGRLRRRVVEPVVELHHVLEGLRRGERFRRSSPRDAPAEIQEVLQSVNALLDERLQKTDPRPPGITTERAALVDLLERYPTGALVVDRRGKVLSASKSALDALAEPTGELLKEGLERLSTTGRAGNAPVKAVELAGGSGWLCFLTEAT